MSDRLQPNPEPIIRRKRTVDVEWSVGISGRDQGGISIKNDGREMEPDGTKAMRLRIHEPDVSERPRSVVDMNAQELRGLERICAEAAKELEGPRNVSGA